MRITQLDKNLFLESVSSSGLSWIMSTSDFVCVWFFFLF